MKESTRDLIIVALHRLWAGDDLTWDEYNDALAEIENIPSDTYIRF